MSTILCLEITVLNNGRIKGQAVLPFVTHKRLSKGIINNIAIGLN